MTFDSLVIKISQKLNMQNNVLITKICIVFYIKLKILFYPREGIAQENSILTKKQIWNYQQIGDNNNLVKPTFYFRNIFIFNFLVIFIW